MKMKSNDGYLCFFVADIQEVFPRHVPGCHLLDRLLLLPDGVSGSSGTGNKTHKAKL